MVMILCGFVSDAFDITHSRSIHCKYNSIDWCSSNILIFCSKIKRYTAKFYTVVFQKSNEKLCQVCFQQIIVQKHNYGFQYSLTRVI